MSENMSVPGKDPLVDVSSESTDAEPFAIVEYEKVDAAHYSFSYSFGEENEYTFRMDESEQSTDHTDFVDAEFDESIPEKHRAYYVAAAGCGLLTGALSLVHLQVSQLKKVADFKEKNWKPLIISAAKLIGYNKGDYRGAAKYIIDRAVRKVERSSKAKEYLSVIAEHPSAAGLVFSIITQYCEEDIVLSENGEISRRPLPDYYVIGETNAEKLVCAVLYWVFSLAADELLSKLHILDELKIPKQFIRIIKEFANSPFMKNIPTDYEEAKKAFSEWLRKMIGGVRAGDKEPDDGGKDHILFKLMGAVVNLAGNSFPVLLNEGLVRGMYMLIRVCHVVKEKQIQSFEELSSIPAADILAVDERVLSRMCLIASVTFVGINIAGATGKAIIGNRVKGRTFSKTFIAELNIPGVCRLVFACAADCKYWGEDIRILLQKVRKTRKETTTEESQNDQSAGDDSAFDSLLLDAVQARILYCLEAISVQYDIARTEKPEQSEKKQFWLNTWKAMILDGIGAPPELAARYFIEDEGLLYDGIYQLSKDQSNWHWFYLLTQELALFEPYSPLGHPEDKRFRKLKQESDYLGEQFVRRQTVVTQDEVESIVKTFSRYKGYVSGRTQKTLIGAGAAVAATVATGGLALSFAPGIAAAIAGEAVVGLHGAALTSASLAFVGGGSLAAGGLGMAGGTAIITGGGALIGLAGSGTASAAAVLLQTPGDYWVRQAAKLMTYCRCVLIEVLEDKDSVEAILRQIDISAADTERELDEIRAEKNDLDKDIIRKTEEYLKYLKRCQSELQRLLK